MEWSELTVIGATCARSEILDLELGSPVVLDQSGRRFVVRDITHPSPEPNCLIGDAEFDELVSDGAMTALGPWAARRDHAVLMMSPRLAVVLAVVMSETCADSLSISQSCGVSGAWIVYYAPRTTVGSFRRKTSRALLLLAHQLAPRDSAEELAAQRALSGYTEATRWPHP